MASQDKIECSLEIDPERRINISDVSITTTPHPCQIENDFWLSFLKTSLHAYTICHIPSPESQFFGNVVEAPQRALVPDQQVKLRSFVKETPDQVRPDKTGPSGEQNTHP